MSTRSVNTLKEDSWKYIKDISFAISSTAADYALSATGYWFIKNQGNSTVYISGAATVTTSNFGLEPGEGFNIPFIIGQTESLRMISSIASQTVAGFLYGYDSDVN